MLDLIFPGVCPACGAPASEGGRLCAECLSEIKLLSEFSVCGDCGRPFGFFSESDDEAPDDTGDEEHVHLCGKCIGGEYRFTKARSIAVYDGKLRDMIHEFKYEARLAHERVLSGFLLEHFPFKPDSFDAVVPVPLHINKLRGREYNQSAVLAQNIARWSGASYDPFGLKKIRDTRPQFELKNEEERRRNVKGAFAVPDSARFRGRPLLLIDDVFTTGSTCDECAGALLKAGASNVRVLTLAMAKGV